MLTCSEVLERISAYLDGETEPALSDGISRHLAECSACRTEAERLSEVDLALRELPRYEVSRGFTAALVAAVREPAAPSRKPDWPSRIFARIFEMFEEFIRPPEPQRPEGIHALEEFDDVPSSFMGHAYFSILN